MNVKMKLTRIGFLGLMLFALSACKDSSQPATINTEQASGAEAKSQAVYPPNPYLADGLSPTTHFRPDQQDSLNVAGPSGIYEPNEVTIQTVPGAMVNLTYVSRQSYPDGEHTIYAANNNRIAKIRVDDGAFQLVSEVQIKGPQTYFTPQDAEQLRQHLDSLESEREVLDFLNKEHARYVETSVVGGGIYNVSDNAGIFYTLARGKILAYGDQEPVSPDSPLELLRTLDLTHLLSGPVSGIPDAVLGMGVISDGHLIFSTISGTVGVVDREFTNEPNVIRLDGEMITNGIATDNHGGIYIVTSKMMRKIVWTGEKLSVDAEDGAWSSPYTIDPPAGGAMLAGGSGSTPSLMGLGDDEDKLVVITDGASVMNAVAFWRDDIPANFQQKPDLKSHRIAGQIRIDFGDSDLENVQSEQSVVVQGYGAVVVNNMIPEPLPTMLETVVASGRYRTGPKGIEKVAWNPQIDAWEIAWINEDAGSPSTVPMVSAGSNQVYTNRFADGTWEVVGLDWDTGELVTRVKMGDSHTYNGAYSLIHLMENGDLFLGGLLGVHRISVPAKN